ncbi:MAG TPA: hypothetical protein VFT74_18805 [Isosphaeraceae bacterium]|nr:hypothetical protein [Isosphaeraceae bacterium]
MAEPIDPVPDSPPRDPVDVPINPDGPPAQPFDVSVSPDQAPSEPFDVPTGHDGPPKLPFDVQVAPDGPPASPVDVQTHPDSGPTLPFDVIVTPDGPPTPPFQVSVSPDASPAAPFQVSVSPDGPPRAPIDVAITPSAPPAQPFQVPTYPDPPAVGIQANPGETPTIEKIIEAVSRFDHALGSFLSDIIDIDPIRASGPGGGALDPTILAKWFRDYSNSVGAAGVAKFVSEQAVLYAMNPVVARIFDPTYFLKMLIPGSMGHAKTTVDVEAGGTMESFALARDEALRLAVSMHAEKPAGDGSIGRPDLYGPENRYTEGQAYSVDSLVDAALGDSSSPYVRADSIAGTIINRFDSTTFFQDRDSFGAQLVRATAKARAASGVENVSNSKLAASNALDGVISVAVPGEGEDGSVLSTTQNPSEVVDDDDTRVPISFTDLRQVPGKRYRSVYFRPENLQFSEAISPEYSEASTFGRVDAVVGYQRTSRTLSVSFDVHAFAPEDLERMYNKMTWLKSMCYPTFGTDSLIQSGPVVRMRIGDAVGTDLGGVPGIIRNLNFDFADAMWELKRGMKVPKMYKVSLDFLVLHDGPVGIVNGVFGVFQLPTGPTPGKDTNLAGNPTDSRTEDAQAPTMLPGRFARFGEPRS